MIQFIAADIGHLARSMGRDVIDQDVEAAISFLARVCQRATIFFFADISDDDHGYASAVNDLTLGCFGALAGVIDHDHRCALLREELRCSVACAGGLTARAGANDQSYLVFQPFLRHLLSFCAARVASLFGAETAIHGKGRARHKIRLIGSEKSRYISDVVLPDHSP